MRHHDIIAILEGAHDLRDLTGLVASSAHGFTVVCDAAPVPILRLPVDRRTALRHAAARQAICETLMTRGTVLPALPQQAVDPSRASDIILANIDVLQDWSGQMSGLVQYQITVTWDQEKVLTRFRDAPEIAPLYARQRVAPAQIERAVHDLAQRLGHDIIALLAPIGVDMAILPNGGNGLANLVILMPPTAIHALDDAVAAIDAIWTEGLHIRQIGPGPAGSFLSLTARQIKPHMLAAARDLFKKAGAETNADISIAAKALLRQPHKYDAETVRDAARILQSASHLPNPQTGFILLGRWAEGRSEPAIRPLEVA